MLFARPAINYQLRVLIHSEKTYCKAAFSALAFTGSVFSISTFTRSTFTRSTFSISAFSISAFTGSTLSRSTSTKWASPRPTSIRPISIRPISIRPISTSPTSTRYTHATSAYAQLTDTCLPLIIHLTPSPLELQHRILLLDRLRSLASTVPDALVDSHLHQAAKEEDALAEKLRIKRDAFLATLDPLEPLPVLLLPRPKSTEFLEKARQARFNAWKALRDPRSKWIPFGSAANTLELPRADLDLVIVIDNSLHPNVDSRLVIQSLGHVLVHENMQDVITRVYSRIPIAKFIDPLTSISCDISCGNVLAIYNTRLLYMYACIDDRVRPLARLIKHWARQRNINSAYYGSIPSFGYILLLLHYLQVVSPPVLPCLQSPEILHLARTNFPYSSSSCDGDLFVNSSPHMVDGCDTTFCDFYYHPMNDNANLPGFEINSILSKKIQKNIAIIWPDHGKNQLSIGELLHGFFYYFAKIFPYSKGVVSVRTGAVILKNGKRNKKNDQKTSKSTPKLDQPTFTASRFLNFCIEDPFNLSNNVGGGISRNATTHIQNEFLRAHQLLDVPKGSSQITKEHMEQALEKLMCKTSDECNFTPPNKKQMKRVKRQDLKSEIKLKTILMENINQQKYTT